MVSTKFSIVLLLVLLSVVTVLGQYYRRGYGNYGGYRRRPSYGYGGGRYGGYGGRYGGYGGGYGGYGGGYGGYGGGYGGYGGYYNPYGGGYYG